MIMTRYFLILPGFYCLTLINLYAQDEPRPGADSAFYQADTAIAKINEAIAEVDSAALPDPLKAALLSAAMPGLGQLYNRSYWKIPVVYGSMMTLGYMVHYFDHYYIKYRNAYNAEHDGNPATVNPLEGTRENNRLFQRIEFYRRNRDYMMILTAGFYLLNVMEAHVDAHLQTFDLSDDITLNVRPGVLNTAYAYHFGITLNLTFK